MTADYPKFNENQDARIKVKKSEHQKIKAMHDSGTSIRAIAREYAVDKRTITFILYPERLQRNVQLRHDRGGSMLYYDREKHKTAMKKHRKRKNKLQGKEFKAWRKEARKNWKR